MNNIENKIKEEFKNREINPSVNSWDKLNSKLNSTQEKEENKKLIYFRIAAVFIGLLVAFSFFLNSNTNKTNSNDTELVKANKEDSKLIINNKKELIKDETEIVKNEDIEDEPILKKEDKLIKSKHVEQNIIEVVSVNKKSTPSNNKNNSVKSKSTVQDARILLASNKKENTQKVKSVFVDKEKVEKEKKDTSILLAQNKEVIKNKTTTKKKIFMNSSDDDIDKMLALALGESKTKKKELIINSNELMLVVENELNINKRSKILNMIKTGVDTVESIIVSNNN